MLSLLPESVAYILICTEIIDDNDIFICTNWVKGLFQLYFRLYDIAHRSISFGILKSH